MSKEIEKKVEQYLNDKGIDYSVNLVGEIQQQWLPQDKPQVCDQWIITIHKRSNKQLKQSFNFHTGTGLRVNGKPKQPSITTVLCSLLIDANACEQSFGDWCSNFGYDNDSIKALEIYMKCQKSADKLRSIVGYDGMAKLREFTQDY